MATTSYSSLSTLRSAAKQVTVCALQIVYVQSGVSSPWPSHIAALLGHRAHCRSFNACQAVMHAENDSMAETAQMVCSKKSSWLLNGVVTTIAPCSWLLVHAISLQLNRHSLL